MSNSCMNCQYANQHYDFDAQKIDKVGCLWPESLNRANYDRTKVPLDVWNAVDFICDKYEPAKTIGNYLS